MLLIVGIGASAGGLDAFKGFLSNVPPDTGMAFVLVQHLAPDYKSMLVELLGKTTSMSLVEAADGVRVMPNCVYVIGPNSTLTIQRGRLEVVQSAPPRDHRRPIDSFFRSLAEDQGENAIGIVLAGTGSDGSLGLTAIKEHGGLTLAQAEFDSHAMPGMPQSAAETGQVDEVLAVEAMPARLVDYQKYLLGAAASKNGDGTRKDAGSHLSTIMAALRARTGHDFSEYKEKTLVRRLQRRMQVLRLETPQAYVEHYRHNPGELELLFRELLIGVTEFFRDPAAFDALASMVLDPLVAGKGADDDIRVWVPGCATGQEAVTIAILLREAMSDRRARPKVQIFATDIDDRAIALARLGRYRRPMAGLSPERVERWFTAEGHDYRIIPEIRDMCVFSTHSIIKHPPFSKLDLISCRNLLIYLDADMQDRVMRTFHYALKPGGRLFLGSSESVTRATRLFGAEDKKHRIFERRDVEGTTLADLSTTSRRLEALGSVDVAAGRPDERIDKSARRATDKYNPPHLVIDERDQIVRFSGPAIGRYLELSPGAPSYGLFDILRKALRPAARAALKAARTQQGSTRLESVPMKTEGHARRITLVAEALDGPDVRAGFVALVFLDLGDAVPGDRLAHAGKDAADDVRALEQELGTTRAQLQSTIDELETTNEELKSSNEEHQSINEELQSSNEELETAKEEMQSVNEEVQTINAEMVSKNEQLTHLNSDLKNLLESTEIATLFLNGSLKVKSFTPGIAEIFHLRDADIGRPIAEVVSLLDYPELQRDARTVLRKLTMIERQVVLHETKTTFILRIRPYRTVDNVIDGVVLTFVDITERTATQDLVRASEARYRALFDLGPVAIYSCDALGVIQEFNRRAVELWGREPAVGDTEARFCGSFKMFRPDGSFMPHELCPMAEVVSGKLSEVSDAEVLIERPDGSRVVVIVNIRPLKNERGEVAGAINCFYDVSERMLHEQQQELLLREMDHRIKNLFAVVAAMVTLTARSATTPAEMAAAVQGRLGALAGAHQLVRPNRHAEAARRQTTLGELARAALSPYIDPAGTADDLRVAFDGPEVALGVESTTSLALVIHELATNAAKYGAFSVPGGRVRVSWAKANGRLALSWDEAGGPPIDAAPEREGFGSLLARRSAQGQLGGDLVFHWNPAGLAVHLSAATERLVQ
ncbi:MAG TPA: chemotaxis protein CheB [Caulobacteraceae bacterium]|nr:chemotaxis protein CheB [Caulobacteraceae bacterium]